MSGATRNDTGWKSYPIATGQSVSPYRAIKGGTGAGVQHAGAGEGSSCIGFYQEPTVASDPTNIAVKLRNAPGTVLVEVAVAVTEGDSLYCAAAGKLTNVASGEVVAKAQEDGSGNGSVIEALPAGFPGDTDFPFNVLPMNGDAISAAAFTASGLTLGMMAEDKYGNRYKLVQYDGGAGPVTAAIGAPVGVYAPTADGDEDVVTADFSDSGQSYFSGIACNTFSEAASKIYGWIMVWGSLETGMDGTGLSVPTTGNVARGEGLHWSADATIEGTAVGGTPADLVIIGRAAADDTGGNVLTKGMIFGACGFNMAA